MLQNYADDPVQAFALDVWNGSQAQAQNFVNATGITYPLLRSASATGAAYAAANDVSFVVDGDGVIRKRMFGFNAATIGAALDAAVADLLTGVDDAPSARAFSLDAAYPNPFNPSTTIRWTLDAAVADAAVRVEIHDLAGRRVARLLDARLPGGREHRVVWDGRRDDGLAAPSGTYVAVVDVDGEQLGRFITLAK